MIQGIDKLYISYMNFSKSMQDIIKTNQMISHNLWISFNLQNFSTIILFQLISYFEIKESDYKNVEPQISPGSDDTTNSSKTSSRLQREQPILEVTQSPSKSSGQSVSLSEKKDQIDGNSTLHKLTRNRQNYILISRSDQSWKSAHQNNFLEKVPIINNEDKYHIKLPELNQEDSCHNFNTSRQFQQSPKLQPKRKLQTEFSQELNLLSAEKRLRKKCEHSFGFKKLLAGATQDTPKEQKEFNFVSQLVQQFNKVAVSNESQIVCMEQKQVPGQDTPEFRSAYSCNSPDTHNSPFRILDSNDLNAISERDFHFDLKKITPVAGDMQECLSNKENERISEEVEFFSLDYKAHSDEIIRRSNSNVKFDGVSDFIGDYKSAMDHQILLDT